MRCNLTPKLRTSLPAHTLSGHAGRDNRRRAVGRACLETLEDRRLFSFGPAAGYGVGDAPDAVAAADFDGDGRQDLAVSNAPDGSISILSGGGGGALLPASSVPTEVGTTLEFAGDFTGDGRPDLLTRRGDYGSYLDLRPGNGDGTFGPRQSFLAGNYPQPTFAAGDVDGDGDADVVMTDWFAANVEAGDAGVRAVLNNGDGTFTLAEWTWGVSENPCGAVAIEDLDADGRADVIVTTQTWWGENVVVSLLGRGDGTFLPAHSFFPDVPARWFAVTELTGDGKPDFAMLRRSDVTGGDPGFYIEVWSGVGDGSFAAPTGGSAAGPFSNSLAAADVNGDGHGDLIATEDDWQSSAPGTLGVYLGRGDGSFATRLPFAVGADPAAVAATDFDGDGHHDLVSANAGSDDVSVLLNDGDWGALPPPPPPPQPALAIGDTTIGEGDSGSVNAVFTVTLSGPSSESVTVQYASAGGSAVSGRDFDPLAGTLTFAPGQTSRTVAVAVRGDRADEDDETFTVDLAAAAGAQLADAHGLGTIADDDPPPSIVVDDVARAEGGNGTTTFTFTVALSAPSERDVWVAYSTADGTGRTADRDYAAAAGTLYFAAGQTARTVAVAVLGDKKREANETFFLNLGDATNGLVADAGGVGTILNDDR